MPGGGIFREVMLSVQPGTDYFNHLSNLKWKGYRYHIKVLKIKERRSFLSSLKTCSPHPSMLKLWRVYFRDGGEVGAMPVEASL